MPFYRCGNPGEDSWAHINFGRRSGPAKCVMPKLDRDNGAVSLYCNRMSVALCDAPACDKPVCEHHRTRHATKSNVDLCPEHKHLAEVPSGG